MDAVFSGHVYQRHAPGVALRGFGDHGVGHLADNATTGHLPLIEVMDDGRPMDPVPPCQCIDRRPFLVEPCKFVDLVRGESALPTKNSSTGTRPIPD